MKAETVETPSQMPPPQLPPPGSPARGKSVWLVWLIGAIVVAAVVLLVVFRLRAAAASSASTKGGRGAMGDIPVDVAIAHYGRLPIYVSGLPGTVTPIQTVTVHTRVDGELVQIAFTEGRIVKKGDLLAQIDPNPYKAALLQAQGNLARDQALLENAKLDLNRYKSAPDAYTAQQIDTQQALVDQDAGIVKSDQGNVDSAQVNLDYCTITSPVTGWVGIRQVDLGNIVHATDTNGIVVITQLQPITVIFSIQQDAILSILAGGNVPPLEAAAMDGDHVLATGKLVAVDSQVDVTSGTLKLRAEYDNSDVTLFPNQLVSERLLINTLHHVVLVPTEAVQTGPDSTFVYVVKSDNSIEVRPVKTADDGLDADGNDVTVIQSGLASGESVVTVGVDNLRAGSKVQIMKTTTRPSRRGSTTQPGGHVRRSLTNDSYQLGSPGAGE